MVTDQSEQAYITFMRVMSQEQVINKQAYIDVEKHERLKIKLREWAENIDVLVPA